MSGETTVHVERNGAVGTIILDRPERRNALNLAMKRAIQSAVDALSADPAIRLILITGARDYFIAGTDIAEMADMTPADHLSLETDGVFRALRRCEKVLVAAVEGYALGGGCELALSCDLVIAGETALFGQPEIRVGIMPGAGGTQRFVRAMGRHRVMRFLLTGEPIPAREAYSLGLISEVVEAGTARSHALALAQSILAMPPLAVAGIRALVNNGPDMPLDDALSLEREAFLNLFDSADQKEGMHAFLEKRRPVYSGH